MAKIPSKHSRDLPQVLDSPFFSIRMISFVLVISNVYPSESGLLFCELFNCSLTTPEKYFLFSSKRISQPEPKRKLCRLVHHLLFL